MNLAQKLIDILKKDNVLLTGGAGVGKSYLVGEVVFELRKQGKQGELLIAVTEDQTLKKPLELIRQCLIDAGHKNILLEENRNAY